MARLQPAANCGAWPLNKDWLADWAPDLPFTALKQAIWDDPRFARRIVGDLLLDADTTDNAVQLGPRETQVLSSALRQMRGDYFRRLGLMWFAPAISPLLLNLSSRSGTGALSKREMMLIHTSRDHAPPALVGPFGGTDQIEVEGQRCFDSWLRMLPPSVRKRCALLLPRLEPWAPEDQEKMAARAAIVLGLPSTDDAEGSAGR
jgi:hypothetical protein